MKNYSEGTRPVWRVWPHVLPDPRNPGPAVWKKRVDYKPGFVFQPEGGNGDHFSKDPGHPGPQAAYPGTGRAIHAAVAAPSLALHRMGFTKLPRRRGTGGLLPRHFTLTPIKGRYIFCCTFPGVTPGSR